jgi:hypothetical protein
MISSHFVPGLRTDLSEVPKRFECPTKDYSRHEHLNYYGNSDLKISLLTLTHHTLSLTHIYITYTHTYTCTLNFFPGAFVDTSGWIHGGSEGFGHKIRSISFWLRSIVSLMKDLIFHKLEVKIVFIIAQKEIMQ